MITLPLPTALALVLLLSLAPPLHALSAHSPKDLFARPQYAVVLSEHGVLNDTVADMLQQQGQELDSEPHDDRPAALHLLRTPAGQAFLCSVPEVVETPVRPPSSEDLATRKAERERGLERGLALLDSMLGTCLYQKQGWFTYSFCYGSHIAQFHALREAGSSRPTEDPNSDAYILGECPAPSSLTGLTPKYGSGTGSAAPGEQARIPATLGGGNEMGVGWDEGGRYLSQRWTGGTVCDKTGLPRSVEVQFHCSTSAGDRIALIRETAICQYVLLVHTPRLCVEPVFLEGRDTSREPAAVIECRPVVKRLREEREDLGIDESPELEADEKVPLEPKIPEPVRSSKEEVRRTPYVPAAQRPAEVPGEALPPPRSPASQDAQDPYHDEHPMQEHSHPEDDPSFHDEQSLDDEHSHPDDDPLLEYETVTLVYDPDTGEIRAAETDDGGQLSERDAERGETAEGQGAATIEGLEDLARIMQKSIADALRQHAGRERRPDGEAAPPILADNGVEVDGIAGLVAALTRGKAGAGAGGGTNAGLGGGDKVPEGKRKVNIREVRDVPRARVTSEQHAKLAEMFERKFGGGEEVEEEEQGKRREGTDRVKDEL